MATFSSSISSFWRLNLLNRYFVSTRSSQNVVSLLFLRVCKYLKVNRCLLSFSIAHSHRNPNLKLKKGFQQSKGETGKIMAVNFANFLLKLFCRFNFC